MKSIFFTVIGLTIANSAFADNPKAQPSWYALLVENLDIAQRAKDITGGGPIASITSMSTLGYSISDISFKKISEQSCAINLVMQAKQAEDISYEFTFLKEESRGTEAAKFASEICFKNMK